MTIYVTQLTFHCNNCGKRINVQLDKNKNFDLLSDVIYDGNFMDDVPVPENWEFINGYDYCVECVTKNASS